MGSEKLNRIIELDGSWDFAYCANTGDTNPPSIPANEQFEAMMTVPACWDDEVEKLKPTALWPKVQFNPEHEPIKFPSSAEWLPDSSLPYIVGVGWYRKVFNMPDVSENALATLYVGGVRLEAWVWLNGQFVGYHFGHSTAFEVSLEKAVINGAENELIIAAANTNRERLGCDLRGYKGFTGGIYRSVYLKIAGRMRISDLYLQSADNNSQINWNTELKGSLSEKVTLDWAVREKGSGTALKTDTVDASGETVSWQTDNCGMECWSDDEPNLYEIEVKLCSGDTVLDTVTQNFGLRTIERKDTSLFFNSKPLFLRGITEHCYFPLTCTPPSDFETYRRIVSKLKELGFNWIRCHTWVPPEEYMQAADELGMMLQVEPPVDFGVEEWIYILKTCRKHPSVVIYCCGNEELLDEAKIEMLKNFAKLQKQYVPDALFNPQEALRGIEYTWTDADMGTDISESPFKHNPARLDAIREFSDLFGHYSWGYLSYISSKGQWQGLTKRMAVYQRPCLAHEIGIQGTYLDLDLEQRYKDLRIGTDLFVQTRTCLEEMGLIDKASLFYKNSCAWQRLMRKHNIETARKCPTLSGYDFLGATDHHNHTWGYTGGIMNEFYELKPGTTVEDIKKYNAQNVLLLDHTNDRNLQPGRSYQFDLMVSLFGPEPLSKGTAAWTLTDGEKDYANGQISLSDIQNGAATKIGRIDLTVPRLTKAAKVRLRAELESSEYELENDWDFWIFPEKIEGNVCENLKAVEMKPGNKLEIVSEIDTDVLERLDKGGSVILLGEGPFPVIPTEFQIGLPGRVSGNRASVIYDHPITEQLPHEGFCDWQFYSMIEKSKSVVFNDLEIPFDPIIELASSYKLICKQASLFEFAVGDGKLLVCTLNLDADDPAVKYLSELILRYAESDAFKPRNSITCDDLVRIQNTKYGPYGPGHTDMAFDPNAQL